MPAFIIIVFKLIALLLLYFVCGLTTRLSDAVAKCADKKAAVKALPILCVFILVSMACIAFLIAP